MKPIDRPKDWFFKVRKSMKKKPDVSIQVSLTENEAREFLASIKSYKNPTFVRAAAKISRQLGRVKHLRSVGLLEVLENE